jgi:hypothetical protein
MKTQVCKLIAEYGVEKETAEQTVEHLNSDRPKAMSKDLHDHVTLLAVGLSWDEATDFLERNR